MSVSTNIHIGPYMDVKGHKTELVDNGVMECSNKKECKSFLSKTKFQITQSFCSECGAPLIYNTAPKKVLRDAYDLLINKEEFTDELCWTDPMGCGKGFFISNHRSPFSSKRERVNSGSPIDLTDFASQEEISWFEQRYSKIINFFKQELGEDSVVIRWGFIEWYS